MNRQEEDYYYYHSTYVGLFLKNFLPELMEAEPPKVEPVVAQPDLPIENPYVPLAKSQRK